MKRILYNKKIIISGKKLEIYNYSDLLVLGEKSKNNEGRKGKKDLSKEQKNINHDRARKDTLVKARNNIIRLIASNSDLQTFITLTYKENFQDISESKNHLNLFFKKLQRDYKEYNFLKYLYVLEFQERGALHYHILTNLNALDNKFNIKSASNITKKSDEQKELENNFRARYWTHGFIDIRNLATDNEIRNISKYVASYLVQELLDLDLQGNRCYGYSRNLDKPITKKISSDETIEDLIDLQNYELKYVNSYDIIYESKLTKQDIKNQVNYFDYIKKD